MLKSLHNHQLSQPTRNCGPEWRIAGGRCREKRRIAGGRCREKKNQVNKYIAIEFVQARQIGLKVKTIFGTYWVDRTVKTSSSDDPTRVAVWVACSARV